MFIGVLYYTTHKAQSHDCLVISTKDTQTRLNVIPCAQVVMAPETIKVVPIR